jgi:hypothetical protein
MEEDKVNWAELDGMQEGVLHKERLPTYVLCLARDIDHAKWTQSNLMLIDNLQKQQIAIE